MDYEKERQTRSKTIEKGGAAKYHASNEKKGKLFVRDRLKLLFDDGISVEDAFSPSACQTDFRLTGSLPGSEPSAAEPFV